MPEAPEQNGHEHQHIEIRTSCPDCGQEISQQRFNRGDLEPQQMSELPNREAMSLVNANVAIPINLGLAANVLSDGSIAGANAQQVTPIDQGMLNSLPTTG
jgi:hypothetical protein